MTEGVELTCYLAGVIASCSKRPTPQTGLSHSQWQQPPRSCRKSLPQRTTSNSYKPAAGCARRFRFEPTDEKPATSSRFHRALTARRRGGPARQAKGATQEKRIAKRRTTGVGHDRSRSDERRRRQQRRPSAFPRLTTRSVQVSSKTAATPSSQEREDALKVTRLLS